MISVWLRTLFLGIATCWGILAQNTTVLATLQGSVVDITSSAIPGAKISIRNQDNASVRQAATDATGQFVFRGVPPGSWKLEVTAPGFAGASVGPLSLSVGQSVTQNISLKPAGTTERLEVTDLPEAIDTAASTAGVTFGGERIEEAPARSRNYLNFVLAAPAVAPSAGASSQRSMTGVRAPLADSGFAFGGMRPRNNAILIDGMDNRDETTGGNRVAVGLEMVQEFRVSAAAIGAELGGAAGGLLNMITRSGVNLWHGDFTMFAQGSSLNASRAEVDRGIRPDFRRLQPGFSFLGPLRRDRTFIALAFEAERERADEWSNLPEFAEAPINAALASPLFAHTNGIRSVKRGLFRTRTAGSELSTKLSHQAGSRDTLSLRYAFSRGRVTGEVQGPDNFSDASAQGSSLTTDHSVVADWMRVLSPTTLQSLRIQVAQRSMALSPNGRGPMYEIPGVATLGQHWRLDGARTERHYEINENLNFRLGGHQLSAGIDAHAVTLDADLRNRFAGVFVFPTLADFTAGRPDIFIQAFGRSATALNTIPIGLWLQDRVELRRGLQAEIGVRFDRQRMPSGVAGSSSNWAPRLGLAWRPSAQAPLVIRAGAGLFYDRYPLAWLNEAVQKDGVHAWDIYLSGPAAMAALRQPELMATLPRSAWRTSPRFPSPYGRKLTIGAEYGLGRDTTLTVEATQLSGFHLPRTRSLRLGGGAPQYLLETSARSDYAGVSVSLNRRLSKDIAFLASYSGGRTRDDGSDFDEFPGNATDARRDWALSRQHQAHRFSASGLFELPADNLSVAPEWMRNALEAITIAPIWTVGSGRPLNALLTSDPAGSGAFPLSARPAGLGRNPFWTPGSTSLDLRVMKTIPLREDRARLQFGMESFNLLNHTNPERVSAWYSAPNGARLASYGELIESLPARQVQFLIQLEY